MSKKALRHEDVGTYAELAERPNPNGLRIVFTPSLASTLHNAKERKGGQLSETEVVRILQHVPAIAVTQEQADVLQEDRGYEDVEPARVYEHWLEMDGPYTD